MKVALYCRVSTWEQNNENQKYRLIEYAKRQGWDYDVIEEKESTRRARTKKNDLMQELRAKVYDGVAVYKLDRWARSSYELLTDITEMYEKGVKFISLSDNIDLSTATGKLQFTMLSAFAEFERSLIQERTRAGIYRARREGKKLGRPKGKKDTKPRRKSGYYRRWAK